MSPQGLRFVVRPIVEGIDHLIQGHKILQDYIVSTSLPWAHLFSKNTPGVIKNSQIPPGHRLFKLLETTSPCQRGLPSTNQVTRLQGICGSHMVWLVVVEDSIV